MSGYVSAAEAAGFLGVGAKTLYAWAASGLVPSYRLGRLVRFRIDELDEWARSNRATTPPAPLARKTPRGGAAGQDIAEKARRAVLGE